MSAQTQLHLTAVHCQATPHHWGQSWGTFFCSQNEYGKCLWFVHAYCHMRLEIKACIALHKHRQMRKHMLWAKRSCLLFTTHTPNMHPHALVGSPNPGRHGQNPFSPFSLVLSYESTHVEGRPRFLGCCRWGDVASTVACRPLCTIVCTHAHTEEVRREWRRATHASFLYVHGFVSCSEEGTGARVQQLKLDKAGLVP